MAKNQRAHQQRLWEKVFLRGPLLSVISSPLGRSNFATSIEITLLYFKTYFMEAYHLK
jgi:hypothetical protein